MVRMPLTLLALFAAASLANAQQDTPEAPCQACPIQAVWNAITCWEQPATCQTGACPAAPSCQPIAAQTTACPATQCCEESVAAQAAPCCPTNATCPAAESCQVDTACQAPACCHTVTVSASVGSGAGEFIELLRSTESPDTFALASMALSHMQMSPREAASAAVVVLKQAERLGLSEGFVKASSTEGYRPEHAILAECLESLAQKMSGPPQHANYIYTPSPYPAPQPPPLPPQSVGMPVQMRVMPAAAYAPAYAPAPSMPPAHRH